MFNFFKKEKVPEIQFACADWAIRKHSPVKPAKDFLPEAWSKVQKSDIREWDPQKNESHITIKNCPAVTEWMQQGYIIPAWCDIECMIDHENGRYGIRYSNENSKARGHTEPQFKPLLDHATPVQFSFKLDNPWSISTKPGWSIQWMPLFYHDLPFQALPGILDPDTQVNDQPINIVAKGTQSFLIKMGTPIVQVVPFKRSEIHGISREMKFKDDKRTAGIRSLNNLSRYGWRNFIRNKKVFTLDRKDVDLEY
jgi:hypothetical protein